jgi:hypothetical protein
MGFRYERWRIRPAQAPRPWRYCSGCGSVSEFVCSGRFRTNAQKKSIDVWLKYLCSSCSAAWKLPVFERTAVTDLPASLLEEFASHDPATVDRFACDLGRLRLHSIRVETGGGYFVERAVVREGSEGLEIELLVEGVCDVRLDRLLARELNVSRALLQRWSEERRITSEPAQKDPLRRPVRDGQRIRLVYRTWADQFCETRLPV